MATRINKLTARQVEHLTPGFHSDGGGLYLRVRESGSRSWVYRYTRAGKVREVGLGGVHSRTLADARSLAGDMRREVANGGDPAALSPARADASVPATTFKACAAALIESKRAGWRNAKHAQQWENTLRDYVYPSIGAKDTDDVTLADVKAILQPLWATKTETATRVRQRIEAVLDWAYVHDLRSGENPARWRGVLDKVLPPPDKVRTVKHFAATPYGEVPALMTALQEKSHISAYCLRFLVLTAGRSIETRGARWSEIDREARSWDIPGERMKSGRPHRVPLSSGALDVLDAVPRVANQDLVFPGARGGTLSDVAVSKALRMVRPGVTVHGFRSSFREWAAEQTNFPSAVCELALAHVNKDRVEAAYQRSDLLERRRELMEAWSGFVNSEPRLALVRSTA